ncbi:hypothetical protein OIE63_15420 [Streptomyces sp. NBC_01795]|uniref:hypothetical protein n=1 Tax=unclassified Streptomyces TaxID=2593676 RepID=UPI002DD8F5ED|nr:MULTISPECIES: hypothetical protein [unclassified Streptomyces]WSA92799.1 hypothetical protein OIE63_15420 [Streptomyces sp. NBC_01795]WSB77169.1 hypothetical protein OHB04_16255 [Streptomyces sp. NBC_01775]WSS14566.1 hypothetical protein OG533_23720 [Streptomyces sp. NBC_01186]
MEPITELRPVNGPVVYGYLRLPRASGARREALATALAEYCRQHELSLSGLFTERGDWGRATPAFAGLLDVLGLPDVYGVVLPAASHLGPRGTATDRRRRIEGAGARLLLVRRNRSCRTPIPGSQK